MSSSSTNPTIDETSQVSDMTMTGGETQTTGGKTHPPQADLAYLADLRQQLGIRTGESRTTESRSAKRAPARTVSPPPTWASFGNATTFDPDLVPVERTQDEEHISDDEAGDEDTASAGGQKKKRNRKKGKAKVPIDVGTAHGRDITSEDMKYLDQIRSSYTESSGLETDKVEDKDQGTIVSMAQPTSPASKPTRVIPRRLPPTPSTLPAVKAGSYLDPSKTGMEAIKAFHQACVATDHYAAMKSETELFNTLKSLMPSGSTIADWAKMSSEVKSDPKAIEAFAYHVDDKCAKLLKTTSEARTWGEQNGLPWGWVQRPCKGPPPQGSEGQTRLKSDCPLHGGQASAKAICEHQYSSLMQNAKWFKQKYDDSIVLITARSSPPPISVVPRYKYDSYVSAARAVHARRMATATYAIISADGALRTELNRFIAPGTSMPWPDLCEVVKSDSDAEKKLKDFFEDKEPRVSSAYKAAHGWGVQHGLSVRSIIHKTCGSEQSTSIPDTCPTKVPENRTAEAVCRHQMDYAASRVINLRELWKLYTAATKAVNKSAAQAPTSNAAEPADTAGADEHDNAQTEATAT